MKKALFISLSVFFFTLGYGQHDNYPDKPSDYKIQLKKDKKDFNVGLSAGVGGVHVGFFPSLDVQYKSVIARVSPGPIGIGTGLMIDLKEIRNINQIWYWTLSGYYLFTREHGTWPGMTEDKGLGDFANGDDFDAVALMTGGRFMIGQRFYGIAQMGPRIQFNNKVANVDDNTTEFRIYFEFSLGFNFSKTYKKTAKKED